MKLLSLLLCVAATNGMLARTPPMGWMSWEIFRCQTDCAKHPDTCISDALYRGQVDGLKAGGFIEAGYTGIHMDDCWEQKVPKRDPKTNELVPEPTRFPNGMKALGDYIHAVNGTFGLYTAESSTTCGGYPASAKHEALDAKTFASWGVDYMKVDGCGPNSYYKEGYAAMGKGLQNSGRDIVYSCSWPAYIGSDETVKPFQEFIDDGCQLWRNYADIQCNWASLSGIIDHWGQYCHYLQPFAAPGHWHDMDMLIIGNGCITHDEEKTQMALWSILASPLIMGNDLRKVPADSKAILLNKGAIAVSQDSKGKMGLRVQNTSTSEQVWFRELANGDVAVALYNKGGSFVPKPMPKCAAVQWNHSTSGYWEACGGAAGNLGGFSGLTADQAKAKCCENSECAGFSFKGNSGYYKKNVGCGKTALQGYEGYAKASQLPPAGPGNPADVTVNFADIGFSSSASMRVLDIWSGSSAGKATGSYTAKQVPFHGTAFVRLSKSL